MIKCTFCGSELNDGANFCKSCGAKVENSNNTNPDSVDVYSYSQNEPITPENAYNQVTPVPNSNINDARTAAYTAPPMNPYERLAPQQYNEYNLPKPKSRVSPALIVIPIAIIVLVLAAVALFYNDNYITVLNAVGISVDNNGDNDDSENRIDVAQTTTQPTTAYAPETMPPTTVPETTVPETVQQDNELWIVKTAEGNNLNLRKGPGTNYDIAAKIPDGTSIYVTGFSGPWAYTEFNGVKGWVSVEFIVKGGTSY